METRDKSAVMNIMTRPGTYSGGRKRDSQEIPTKESNSGRDGRLSLCGDGCSKLFLDNLVRSKQCDKSSEICLR